LNAGFRRLGGARSFANDPQIETYFGDNALLAKFVAGTPTSINSRVQKNGQALIFQFPCVTYRGDGNPATTAKNTDVMLPLARQAFYDSATAAHAILDRLEYYESWAAFIVGMPLTSTVRSACHASQAACMRSQIPGPSPKSFPRRAATAGETGLLSDMMS
jgi:hypothetical protein